MKLSSIISDGMVLQRNKEITLAGETTPLQNVEVNFVNKTYSTTADHNGNWTINIEPLEPGGPYQMLIIADESLTIHDILVGDVWVLGGQSNMELPVSRTLDLFYNEVKAVHHPYIRQFSVPQNYDFQAPKQELTGGHWISATNRDVMKFSAAGYFFAQEIHKKYGVPVGVIQAAVGGTPIEAWMSEKTLRVLGGYETELELCKDDAYIATTKRSDEARQNLWHQQLNEQDLGLKDEGWYSDSQAADDWHEFEIPNSWEGTELEPIRGAVWFKREFELPETTLEGEAKLSLGTIVDADETYVNGILVGSTGYRYPPRRYSVPKEILRPGKNTLTVRVISTQTTGEFIKDMPYKIMANGEELDLQGTWKYKVGALAEALEPQTFFQYKPSGLYNGMIAPLSSYGVKGVLFYQGESNTGRPKGYRELFKALVSDWRENWKQGEIPFIYTQLANLDTGEVDSYQSNWATLREEQRLSLTIPNTAMAVTIDIGEHNDLHPQDKKTLGQRLALCTESLAYHENIVYSGPLFREMKKVGSTIHLFFDHVGSGLSAGIDGSGLELKSFTICDKDGKFVPATAIINGDTIIVEHNQIKEPHHVRYAWKDNPEEANLYNKEGLPASPFSTE